LPDALVTRPLPDADDTAAALRARGWGAVVTPLMRVTFRPVALPPVQAVLVASRNAARALPAFSGPVLAVGDATAAEARNLGFAAVSADGDAAALAQLSADRLVPAGGPLAVVTGAGQGAALAHALRARGFRVVRRVGYAMRPVARLPAPAQDALRGNSVVAVMHFSRASALAFASLVGRSGLTDRLSGRIAIAIGQPAAEALRSLPWREVRVAARPTQDAMLELLP
jgi:uroporphyrinogen-III synthase